MTGVPTGAAIKATELRLLQARRNVELSVGRTRLALHTAIARPSSLVLVAVVSGMSALLLSHRRHPSPKSVLNCAHCARAPSPGLVRTFVSMYGARVLAFALQFGATAGKSGVSPVDATRPNASSGGDTTPTDHKRPDSDQRGMQ